MNRTLEARFHQEMLIIYERAKSLCNYNATRFLKMVTDQGGIRAAKQLLNTEGISEGLTALWECQRLDITMEALILQEPWSTLFTEQELNIARERLTQLGYDPGA